MSNIKIDLSEKGLDELLKKLNTLNSDINKSSEKIVSDLVDYGVNEATLAFNSVANKDGNSDYRVYGEKQYNSGKILASGTNLLYLEFGTGTLGFNDPHPLKSNYNLKAYNSGKKIHKSKSHSDKLGWYTPDGIWTEGIPSGKQMYNTSLKLKNKISEISRERIGDVISKL